MDESLSTQYFNKLISIGVLPVELCDEHIYVHGYATAEP